MSEPQQRVAALPLIAPIGILPSPMPCETSIGSTQIAGQRIVVLQIATAQGVSLYTLSQEQAKAMSQHLQEHAGGIVVVGAGALPRG
jgi:hypothetical protein